MPEKKNRPHPAVDPVEDASTLRRQSQQACSDVLGSYTGTPADGDDIPEQDADDL